VKLYLVRHGDAVSEFDDPERPLSDVGISEAESLAEYLENKKVAISTIFHSTKKRAAQTAQIIGDLISSETQLISKDYLTPDGPINKLIAEISSMKSDLMVVSHMPFIPRLVESLVEKRDRKEAVTFRTGAVIVLDNENSDCWRVAWSFRPELS